MTSLPPPSLTTLADFYQREDEAQHADMLSPVSAAILEECLQQNQPDLLNRARLLGFYARYYWKRKSATTKMYRDLRAKHILWFIENAPDCKFAGDNYFYVDKSSDEVNYSRIRAAWEAAQENSSQAPHAAINAILFFHKQEPVRSQELLESLIQIRGVDEWSSALIKTLELELRVHDLQQPNGPCNPSGRKLQQIKKTMMF